MPVHPQVERVLALVEQAGNPDYWDYSFDEARSQYDIRMPILDAPPVDVGVVEDFSVDGDCGPIPVRIYRPVDAPEHCPAVLWTHGGGHVLGSIASYDSICRRLCQGTGAVVVSVEYRLAPEHPFPAAVQDSFAALKWLVEHAPDMGIAPTRIAVAGDSAGGNLAAVNALLARDAGIQLAAQALVYPATAPDAESDSHHDNADGYLLTREHVLYFQGNYRSSEADRTDFRYAPLIASDHSNLAPALVQVAEFDPLRDEGIAYATALISAGNDVTLSHYAGMVHAFFGLSAAVDAGKRAMDEVCQFLRAHLK